MQMQQTHLTKIADTWEGLSDFFANLHQLAEVTAVYKG